MEITKRSEEVIATIRAMNRCWTGGWNEAQFRQYINPDPVALVPTTSGMPEGQEACAATWRAFKLSYEKY